MADGERSQSVGEEIANAVSHGVGFLAALAGTPILISKAARSQGAVALPGACVFAATLLLLYLASTLYHALPPSRAKRVFRVIEHSAIFLLIAGTYTPFTLGVLRGAWGGTLLGLVWGLAILGILLKIVGGVRYPILSTCVYVAMGWLVVFAIRPLSLRLPTAGLVWIVLGGLAYTAGVPFFATSRLRFGHFVWHLFVLAGSFCHFFAVLWYAS